MNKLVPVMLSALTLLFAGCAASTPAPNNTQSTKNIELNVSAAVSMKDALTEIQKSYEAAHPNVKIVYNLGASGSLQKQIEQGAPCDIFISAAAKQMNELEGKNLLKKDTRKNLVENQLVMIVPQNTQLQLAKFEDFAKPEITKIGLGEPGAVPAGQYAQQSFTKLGFWDKIKDKVVFAKDVRTVLAYVETGNVEAGVVYKTDALSSSKVKIVATAPSDTHDPVVYPMAILASTKQAEAAQDFYNYLTSSEAKAVLEKAGFTMSN